MRRIGQSEREGWFGRRVIAGSLLAGTLSVTAEAAISPPPPAPDEGTTVELFVGDVATYDSNLYRIPANFGPVASAVSPNATRADFVDTVSAGAMGQWLVGLQDIDLTLRADESKFAHNTALDNTGGDAQLRWNWRVGPYFSGVAGGEYNRALASFAEERYLGRDLVDSKTYYGSARWQVGPRWAAFGGVLVNDISHGAPAAAFNDFKTNSGNVGVEYATGVANVVGLEYRYTDGTYPPNYTFDNVPFDRNFKDNQYRANLHYVVTEKTQIDAYAGYLKHALPSTNILSSAVFGNFSGDIWRVTANWAPTEKTQLTVAGWHELHAYLVNASNYFLSQGFSLAAQWKAREKITATLVLSRESQSYSNLNTVLANLTAPRHDTVTGEQFNVFYLPTERITVNFFVRNEQRDSNENTNGYNDKLANLSVTYKFW